MHERIRSRYSRLLFSTSELRMEGEESFLYCFPFLIKVVPFRSQTILYGDWWNDVYALFTFITLGMVNDEPSAHVSTCSVKHLSADQLYR